MTNTPSQPTILFADDDALLRTVYSAKFREEGFEVWDVNNGEEAWNLINSGKIPSLLITGIQMPRMTGFDLIGRLKLDERLKDIPFFVFSHRGLEEDRTRALGLGAAEFIIQSKTTPNEVVRRVKLLLGLKTTFKISISHDQRDNNELLLLIARQHGVAAPALGDAILDIQPTDKAGEFTISFASNED